MAMAGDTDYPLTLSELEQAVAAADSRALLVPPRILRRVIKQHCHISGIGLRVPHRKTFAIEGGTLLTIVDRDELGLEPAATLPTTVLLLARPDAERLASMTAAEALVKYWRLLFHARVHVELDRRLDAGALGEAALRERIQCIGASEFDEVRAVLRQEDLLTPPHSNAATYVEFVAVYLELRHFAPSLLPRYFSTLRDYARIDALLATDIDGEALFQATRLPGAPDPAPPVDETGDEPAEEPDDAELWLTSTRPSERGYRRFNRRADRALATGNAVRAAILRSRAARHVRPSLAARARAAARDDLNRLADRLQAALDYNDRDAKRWSRALATLLSRCARGFWTRESRILYDLQKVCVDFERDVYRWDWIEWAASRGASPLKRRLPGQREVLMCKHLRSAARRATGVRLADRDRTRLLALLDASVRRAEERLRNRFRPVIGDALTQVDLKPANVPEQVALHKLVEELLDRVVERGFLSMGDLRDAISRNNLKLPDLAGAHEFFSGDRLLLADRRLAATLDGVYRRGEVYLRWPQRFSSLAFGTHPGRLLVRYVALPYGGAYLAIEGVKHIVGPLVRTIGGGNVHAMSGGAVLFSVFLLGTFLLGLLHVDAFRRGCLSAVKTCFRALREVFFEVPVKLLRLPWVRRILDSRYYRLVARYVFKPLVFSGLALAAFPGLAPDSITALRSAAAIFAISNLLMNSRVGRNAEEVITDWTVRGWHHFRIRILTASIQMVMEFFNRVVDTLDRLLYSVDEWLRFRSGQRRLAIAAKAVLGVIWFFVTYVVRFCLNLLIEPQINPVKHFPVVTVSHKILLSFSPLLIDLFEKPLEPLLGEVMAKALFGGALFVLPGVFGFLVWELKENWRLYQANRPRLLAPVSVGRHGETLVRLLRPGFHSGTLPKLYARLRRADRKAHWTGNWKRSRKYRDAIQQVRHDVRCFVEREFLTLLGHSRRWDPLELQLQDVEVGSNSIRLELLCPDFKQDPLWLALDEQSGWLIARVAQPGWTRDLNAEQSQALADALTGLYKMAGVDLVREQIEALLERPLSAYDITEQGLVVWTGEPSAPEVRYNLRPGPNQSEGDLVNGQFSELERDQLVFSGAGVGWELWVEVWDRDRLGGRFTPRLVIGAHLLPETYHWAPN